jgi:hypothetical protein
MQMQMAAMERRAETSEKYLCRIAKRRWGTATTSVRGAGSTAMMEVQMKMSRGA